MSTPPFSISWARLPVLSRLSLGVLAVGIVALCRALWRDWNENPDLSHGFFMPLVFLALLWESRANGTPRFLRCSPLLNASFVFLSVAGLVTLTAAGLYAASVDWSHALVTSTLTWSLVLFLGAALLHYSAEDIQLVPFNWTAVVAITLWLLTAPIPPGTYTRLTLTLQLWVSENVLHTLHLLGVPAIRHGNIIELANTTVGVEEACSGVRSLISCVFAGFFFSATLVRRPGARALIVLLAAPLALGMNFLRSLTLTLLSNGGVDISGKWHDLTGFAVLGITAAILGGLAVLLEPKRTTTDKPAAIPPAPAASRWRGAFFAGTSAVAAALVVLFVFNTRPSIQSNLPPPDLLGLMPAAAEGWEVRTTDLYQFSGTLQTNFLAQRQYRRLGETNPTEVTLYVAYWQAGQAPVSLVASHTPDACLPGSGWTALPTSPPRVDLNVGPRTIPDAEYRLFQLGEYPQYVWFWHLYDGRPISYRDPRSPAELLRIAWRYGFRHDGDQVFVRLSSNRPWAQIAKDPLVATLFDRLKTVGL
jgi:exosortase